MLSDRDYMRPESSWRPWLRPQGSVIKPLIWANVIIFLLTGFGASGPGRLNAFFELLHLHPYYFRNMELWRLGTYMFVHGGLAHIFFNMWGLYLFGQVVEAHLGPHRFMRLYLFSGLTGGAAWLLANWNPRGLYVVAAGNAVARQVIGTPADVLADPSVRVVQAFGGVVGASGAVFGVMMAAAMAAPNMRIMLLFPPVPMRLKTFVAGYALIEVFLALQANTRIAHLAHLGGLVCAFFYMQHLGYQSPYAIIRKLCSNWRYQRISRRFRAVASQEGGGFGPSSAEVDRILDKIGRQGIGSLNDAERLTLLEAGRRLKQERGR